jgi:ribonuclease-3
MFSEAVVAFLLCFRMNYCATTAEMQKKLEELAKMKPEEIVEHEKKVWTRTAPADLYYVRDEQSVSACWL